MTTPIQFARIETPAVLLDYEQLLANIRLGQRIARQHGVAMRPHVKTHKCHEIACLQIAEGAVGITASKTDEAMEFIRLGIGSVTVAYPVVVSEKLDRLLSAAAARRTELRIVADSREGVDAIQAAACRHGTVVPVLLKIDVGLHRCGVREDDPGLVPLARRIEGESGLRFAGLLSHAGQAYGAKDADGVRAVAREECEILMRVRARLEKEGIPVPTVSVGSTPTVLASESYDGITEIRPGNYVFMDRTPIRLGLVPKSQAALTVLATIVSRNADYFIIDAGSKVLSSDLGAHSAGGIADYGLAYPVGDYDAKGNELAVRKVSEEHGFVVRGGQDLPIGSQVRIIPNHSCVVINLVGEYTVLKAGGDTEVWQVPARGRVR
jgi:D-serine deaminase-like pyridoxal phosphate-dependent protein